MAVVMGAFTMIVHTVHTETQLMQVQREANNLLFQLLQEQNSVSGLHSGEFDSYQGSTIYKQEMKEACLQAQGEWKREIVLCLPAYDA